MFYKIEDFKSDWGYESQATLKIFKALTNDSLETKVYDEGRTLGYLAWHIIDTLLEMPERAGLIISAKQGDVEIPTSPEGLAELFERFSSEVLQAVIKQWKDENLNDVANMYGEDWKHGVTLRVLINHMIHHRGQMTVLMRQAGLVVPGIYGPAKEEWVQYGMPSHP